MNVIQFDCFWKAIFITTKVVEADAKPDNFVIIKETNEMQYIRLDLFLSKDYMVTLITVQCSNDADSQGRGLKSLLGTPDGTLLGTLKDSTVHRTTIKGTP